MAAFVNVSVSLLVPTNASLMVNKELVNKCAVFFTLFFLGVSVCVTPTKIDWLQGTCYGAYVATAMCKFDSLYGDNNKDSSCEKICFCNVVTHLPVSNSSNVLYILQTSIADINTYVSWRGKE